MRGLRGNGIGAGTRTGENLREHPRKANVGSNRREQKKAKKTSARFSAEKELARVWKGCRRQGGTERSGVKTER